MRRITCIVLILSMLNVSKGLTAMSISSNDFQNKYEQLFQDVKKLNEFTRHNYVKLSNVSIAETDISGSEFYGAEFNGIKFKNSNLENCTFVNVTFQNCEFFESNLNASKFIDCIFRNCKINYSKVNRAIFKKGRFFECNIENSGMVKWKGDTVSFDQCKILDSPLAQGNIQFSFSKTDLDGVRVMMSEGLHPLLIEGGTISEVDFGKSHFSTVTLRGVKQGEGGVYFNGVNSENISFEDVEMLEGTGIGDATVGTVRIIGGKMYGPAFKNSKIAKTYIRDAYLTRFALGNMGQVLVTDSILHRSGFFRGGIEELSVSNSTIDEVVGKNFKADTVIWDNVTLDGKIDFTNAHIKEFQATRLKRGPNLQLITTGSNVKL